MIAASLPRSYLYVPGNEPQKLAKALQRGADALIVDLEDAVPLSEKDGARQSVIRWLSQQDLAVSQIWVRVNSGDLRSKDVSAIANIAAVSGLVLAKVESSHEVAAVSDLLGSLGDRDTLLMPLIETAAAVLAAPEIAAAPRVHQLQIGEVDLAGETGIEPGDDESELAGIRTMIVLASVAAQINSPVGPVSRITTDLAALLTSTQRLRRQGFIGRACIHPVQIPVAHDVFTPSEQEVAEARAVISLLQSAEDEGRGVVLDAGGRLVDVAVLRAARKILARTGAARNLHENSSGMAAVGEVGLLRR